MGWIIWILNVEHVVSFLCLHPVFLDLFRDSDTPVFYKLLYTHQIYFDEIQNINRKFVGGLFVGGFFLGGYLQTPPPLSLREGQVHV